MQPSFCMRLRLVKRIRFQYWTPIFGAPGTPNQTSEVIHLGGPPGPPPGMVTIHPAIADKSERVPTLLPRGSQVGSSGRAGGRGVPGTPWMDHSTPPELRPHVGMILWDQGGSIPRIKISYSPKGDLCRTTSDGSF